MPTDLVALSALDTLWVLLATFLVFFMQAGFALLEAGFTQAKNTVNIIMKNVLDVSFGTLVFYIVGFGLMFGSGNAFVGMENFFMTNLPEVWGSIPTWAFFLFQAVFAATASTIVSGAVAERTKFGAYLIFAVLLSGLIYPIAGHWIWGGGWLAERGFIDFAGSTVVHSVGGWAALAGIYMIGARKGRFKKGYDQKKFDGHSIPLAALGTFILWFGWFGFNAGSQLAAEGAENANTIALIALNTQLAAASGAISALLMGYLKTGIAKMGFTLNGALAGLVAITAPCAFVSPTASILIGFIGGVVMMLCAEWMEKARLDDAVGAVPVHLGAGIWGTLAVGLFHLNDGLFYGGGIQLIIAQITGIAAVGIFTFISSLILLKVIAVISGLRASANEEETGLDYKHGEAAYPHLAIN